MVTRARGWVMRGSSRRALGPGVNPRAHTTTQGSPRHRSSIRTTVRHQPWRGMMPRHTKAAALSAALQSRPQPAFVVSPGVYPRARTGWWTPYHLGAGTMSQTCSRGLSVRGGTSGSRLALGAEVGASVVDADFDNRRAAAGAGQPLASVDEGELADLRLRLAVEDARAAGRQGKFHGGVDALVESLDLGVCQRG